MYGLEQKARGPFEFDLEKELRGDAKKRTNLLKYADTSIGNLKTKLREGEASEDFDKCGVLLHGYSALKKVVENVA